MDTARADEIRRAMAAVEQAPQTETGLLIPPHVAAERQRAAAAALEPAKPNRAERRRREKQQRRNAKRQARLERAPVEVQEAWREVEEATAHLTETELIQAEAILKDVAEAPELRSRLLEELA